ncbi:MAG TPA: lysophospholipid acyltransferase family protein [Spirochaetales bacterium]|nr:1-acyl-sn-glycerol-3-phosphate acyltransferase [Spirochaetia bacterium]HPE36912.1 lysophospholipid acyltransferase family protein [Spirochaetales bacterium]
MGTVLLLMIVLVVSVFMEIPCYAARFLPKKARKTLVDTVARASLARFVAAAKAYMGMKLIYERGVPRLPPRFIVVANHQSLLDIPILMDFFRGSRTLLFVAKRELGTGIPLISSVLRLQGHALVPRSRGAASAMKALGRMARKADVNGYCPAIFPEGTRSRDGRLGVFHTAGLKRLLEAAPVPILVVAMAGGMGLSTLRHVVSSTEPKRYRVKTLAVFDPPGSRQETEDALVKAKSLIQDQLDRWRLEA